MREACFGLLNNLPRQRYLSLRAQAAAIYKYEPSADFSPREVGIVTFSGLTKSRGLNYPLKVMDSSQAYNGGETSPDFYHRVIVMRHGHRMDNFDPEWVRKAARPWDPPLFEDGKTLAFETGQKFRGNLGFPIHRVFVSPFLRCVQTAAKVVEALCAVNVDAVTIDPSKIKVSIEYGLCEMLSEETISLAVAPKDWNWGFNIPDLEAIFPVGTVDNSVERVYKEMPQWGEGALGARTRYEQTIETLADKYPSENLLLVTHGEGVSVSVSAFEGTRVSGVKYCAYSELERCIFRESDSLRPGKFKVLNKNGIKQ